MNQMNQIDKMAYNYMCLGLACYKRDINHGWCGDFEDEWKQAYNHGIDVIENHLQIFNHKLVRYLIK